MLSFLNCEKYPPSLLYLMMTLGPALILLALLERAHGRIAGWITAFGRVPFFFYVLHIVVIHALAVALAWATLGDAGWLFGAPPRQQPAGFGLSLPGIYAVWLLVVLALQPLCRWFAALKQRRREPNASRRKIKDEETPCGHSPLGDSLPFLPRSRSPSRLTPLASPAP
jgi:hypothetical protein